MESKIEEIGDRKYRINLIPAYYAQQFLAKSKENGADLDEESIVYMMSYVDAKTDAGWVRMEDADAVDANVEDWMALDILIEKTYEANFGFLRDWKMWRVPNIDGFEGSEPKQLSSFIHSIITNGYATLEALKTTVSLRDAFEMQDSILTKAMSDYRYMKIKGMI
jgi:hypothetical protein